MKTNAPILLFAYNRPNHLQHCIENLERCKNFRLSPLFLYCDGPKKNADSREIELINSVRAIATRISHRKNTYLHFSPKNIGLATSIIDGVSQIVEEFGKVIVLEDDLLVSPCFLDFMNKALQEYENIEEVISISGYTYPIQKKLRPTFFLRGADCWGWATWKRGWNLFNPNGKELLEKIMKSNLERTFNFENTYDYTGMLKKQIEGKNSSWAIRWYASAFLENKLTLYPGKSLVENIGHDGSGTHGASNKWDGDLSIKLPQIGGIEIEQCEDARSAVRAFFRSLKRPRWINKSFSWAYNVFN